MAVIEGFLLPIAVFGFDLNASSAVNIRGMSQVLFVRKKGEREEGQAYLPPAYKGWEKN
jgi:hypothetical protein